MGGPNGAGKSTLLRQTAVIVVLAQVGGYVPADAAALPLRRSLLSRLGTCDDLENNLSTFMVEMRETAQILRQTSGDKGSGALVLIDELGRATSNRDGIAIAYAVAEALASTDALTMFITHFPQLARLAAGSPGVRLAHLSARLGGDGSVGFDHTLCPGKSDLDNDYGLSAAVRPLAPSLLLVSARSLPPRVRPLPQVACGWPAAVVADARVAREALLRVLPGLDYSIASGKVAGGTTVDAAAQRANALLQRLAMLKNSQLSDAALRECVLSLCCCLLRPFADATPGTSSESAASSTA